MSLTYTDSGNVQHKVTVVRVDDPSVLPLTQSQYGASLSGPVIRNIDLYVRAAQRCENGRRSGPG